MSFSHKSEATGFKDCYALNIMLYTETMKLIQILGRRCKNSRLYQKMA